MSIFDRIKHAIFGDAHAAPASQVSNSSAATISPSSSAPTSAASSSPTASISASAPAASSSSSPAQPAAASFAQTSQSAGGGGAADIETILNDAVKKSGQKLDWRHSIVDLMKALGMDASLEERKELAQELDYSGDAHDSAKMNTFLHKALMKKLSENGGKVPADLLD
ncbi:DUF3597 domain-containing protein [Rhizobium rhizoryzae]|uniref:DUF3597 domain-containing protein n=1 Tax=Rhizobium rhizoryzae TaxID=451876 RepID=UPI002898A430|nr:DUF3597 domain-containing protein [Rhizobium rhizoryzae]